MSFFGLKCPACSNSLEGAEYEKAAKQLEKSVVRKYRDQLREERQEHAKRLAQFKQEQQRRLQAMAKKQQSEKKSLQKRVDEKARKSREGQKRDLAQLRKNYQMQLEQIREINGSQNAALQNELKASFASQLEEMKKNYEGLSASNQRQLETLQKYLEDKLVGELREKVNQWEQDKLSTESRFAEMVQQLDDRNAEIVSMKERLCDIDTPALGEQEAEQAQTEAPEPVNNQQEELLKMVKEVAQQQELGGLRELQEDYEEEKHGFWARAGKKFGLF